MSNILSDILGLNAKKQYKGDPLNAKDVFVIGDVHEPKMLGIASPIPIRDEKLVTFYDLALSVIGLLRIENATGSPPPSVTPGAQLVIGPDQTGNPFLWKVRTLTSTDNTVAFSYTGADSEQVDLSMTLSTDVHVDSVTYDTETHDLVITMNSGTVYTINFDTLALEVLEDGASIETNVSQLNFIGAGVAIDNPSTGVTDITLTSPVVISDGTVTINTAPLTQIEFLDGLTVTEATTPGKVKVTANQRALTIQEEGSDLTPAGTNGLQFINFIGDGVTASPSATNGTIDVTVNSPVIIEDEGSPLNPSDPLTVIDFVGDGVTASQTSPGEIQVSIPQINIADEGIPVTVTGPNGLETINFIGNNIEATAGAAGIVDVTVLDQEEHIQLISNTAQFSAFRPGGSGAYTIYPPSFPYFRLGGPNSIGSRKLYSPFVNSWSEVLYPADIQLVGGSSQQLSAKEDQMTMAIPTPVDLAATDKIKVVGTCFVNQGFAATPAQLSKIKVAVFKGTCTSDRDIILLNDPSVDTFTASVEDATGTRSGEFQRICFELDALIGGSGVVSGDGHFFIGFSFQNLILDTEGDYTDSIIVNFNMSAIKNPS